MYAFSVDGSQHFSGKSLNQYILSRIHFLINIKKKKPGFVAFGNLDTAALHKLIYKVIKINNILNSIFEGRTYYTEIILKIPVSPLFKIMTKLVDDFVY